MPPGEISDDGRGWAIKLRLTVSFHTEEGERFFGEGPYRLLLGVEERHSLRASAQTMGMAYTKAFRIIKNAEAGLGFPLLERSVGGKGGGGSTLTPQAKELLRRYGAYRISCDRMAEQLYQEHFSGFLPAASSDYRRKGEGQDHAH